MTRPDYAHAVRGRLCDPMQLCAALNLLDGANRSAAGVTIRCPAHEERTPSCSVTRGPDGTVRAKCFGCQWSADALGMIATVHKLDVQHEFRAVLILGAELGGDGRLADEIRGNAPREDLPPPPPRPEPPPPPPPREYPPADELVALWSNAISVADDAEASGYLVGRKMDPDGINARLLLRVIAPEQELPQWARYKGQTWSETGHRILARVWDCNGTMRSVRAWRCRESDAPKRLPPAGHRASELVLANRAAVAMLGRGIRTAEQRVIICEGEPDHTVVSLRFDDPVIGVGSGSWSQDFASRIPGSTKVYIWTHRDEAGDKYAAQIAETLGERVELLRAK